MNQFPGLVDSHFHILSMQEKKLDVAVCLNDFFDRGGSWALDVGVTVSSWEDRYRWKDLYPRVVFSSGIHPSQALHPGSYDQLETHLTQPKVVALGEIGLDWFRGKETEKEQKKLFRDQLEIALAHSLPVILHNREADREILEILHQANWTNGGIFHCFSSGVETARKALDLGFYLSFAGNVTLPKSDSIQESAAFVPRDRYLVETDSPYLAPLPVRGKPNRPSHTVYTAQHVARLRNVDLETVIAETKSNFETLFSARLTGRE